MAEAQIECLSRLTAGEVSKDQAIIDYFYYDTELNFKDVMTPGFFDKLSKKFKVGSRISFYCLGNNFNPPNSTTLKRLDVIVAALTPYTPPRNYERVKLLSAPGTWQTNDLSLDVWESYSCTFRGLVSWITPPLPNPNPGINVINIPNILLPLTSEDVIIFNQPYPGDTVQRHMVRSVSPQAINVIYAQWAPVTIGAPLAVVEDPPAGLPCTMFIEIMSNIVP